MNNIILQHYTGEPGELEKLSIKNISAYAKFCGADYKLIQGSLFNPQLSHPCQKVHMLSEDFDNYDIVVMVDIDMFTKSGMSTNIFTEVTGIGMYTDFQANLHNSLSNKFPNHINKKYAYWGGAIYRLTKEQRILLRSHINMKEYDIFNRGFEDEGIMARLATLAKIPVDSEILPGGFRWCHCSYREGIEDASMIHIRTKITPVGPKRLKIENYREMVNRGLIDE